MAETMPKVALVSVMDVEGMIRGLKRAKADLERYERALRRVYGRKVLSKAPERRLTRDE